MGGTEWFDSDEEWLLKLAYCKNPIVVSAVNEK
jgi:hypothetical protein